MYFKNYYKYSSDYRFYTIAKTKINIIAKSCKKEFNIYLVISIVVFLSFPCLQFIIPQINPNHNNYNFKLYNYDSLNYWYDKIFIFNIIGVLSIISSYVAFHITTNYRLEDFQKKSKLINRNNIVLLITFIGNLIINICCIAINEQIFTKIPDEQQILRLIYFVGMSLMYSTSIYILMLVFVGTRNLIKFDLLKMEERMEEINKYSSIYWLFFFKNIFISTPSFWVGTFMLTILTATSFVIFGGSNNYFRQFYISSVSFYSFYITSVLLVVSPILTGTRKLNSVYDEYTQHIIRNSILPNLRNHIVLFGIGNLGSQIIRNSFEYIHPEHYGTKSHFSEKENSIINPKDKLSDYNLTIDKNLKIQLISQRIVVYDKDQYKFKEILKTHTDASVGIFNPWLDREIPISILGVCGDKPSGQVLNILAIQRSNVIINATPNSIISLSMASRYRIKQILSVNDSYSFDTLTSTTYDKAIFLIDSQAIEGLTLSQLIFQLVNSNIRHNLQKSSSLFKKVETLSTKKKNNDFNFEILKDGNGKILIVGSGNYIYNLLQSLILTLTISMDLNSKQIKYLIENKVYLLTNDKRIKLELIKNKKVKDNYFTWKFYPLRNNTTKLNDFYLIQTYFGSIENFEKNIDVISSIINYPEIIILLNPHSFTAIDMFISSTTAIEIINKTLEFRHNKKNMYNPHILAYSSRNDEFYLTRHFKKYLTFNKNRIDKIGYPTQLVKESFIIKDWQSALRYTSILKAFISENNFTQQKEKFDCHIAEITFSAREQNGSLANLAASLAGKEIIYETYKDSKVPRFLNYHSSAEIYYKDTFLFKGLAILENRCDINGVEDILNYYFINCERKSRDKIYELVNDNLGIKQPLGSVNNLVDEFKKRDLGMFSNYTGSSILRHPDKYFDIIHRRPTFYFSPNPPKPIIKKNTDISLKNRFNVGDFTIWSDGEDTPGSLAEVLAEVILCKTREKKGIKNNKWDVQVFHSSNRPSPYCNHEYDKINSEETVFTQDSFYIRLKPKSKNNMKLGLIRAIKVKLSGEILLEDLDWTEYLFKLIEHLNSKSTFKYILYIIDRLFIEGLDAEGQSRTTSVNYYFKVDNKICLEKLKNGNSSHFKILRTWEEVKEIGKWKEIPKIIFNDDLDNYYKVNRSQVQRYEFVLIRDDIINDSQKEIKANLQFGKSQNKLYYIDDI